MFLAGPRNGSLRSAEQSIPIRGKKARIDVLYSVLLGITRMAILLCTFVLLAVFSVLANAVWSGWIDNKRNLTFLVNGMLLWRDDESPLWKRLCAASVAFLVSS